MPRIRTIKPEFWRNRSLASLSPFTRLVAIAILNVADDDGYFEADPLLIRGDVFPFQEDSRSITVALRELAGIGYVAFRTSKEKGVIGCVVNFRKHQVINKPSASRLKEIYLNSLENSDGRDHSGNTTGMLPEDYVPEQGAWNLDLGKEHEDSSEPSRASEPVDTSIVFDCVGKDPGPWSPPLKLIQVFRDAYPHHDIVAELRKAVAWIVSNPGNRKTKKGMPSFLNRWMARAKPTLTEGTKREKTQAEKDAILAKVRADRAKEDGRDGT